MEQQINIEIPNDLDTLQLPEPNLLQFYKDASDRTFWIDFDIDDCLLDIIRQVIEVNKQDKGVPIDAR